jgi:transcription initiation factor IIE alpha subunit
MTNEHAPHNGSGTSRAAAASIEPHAGTIASEVLAYLRGRGDAGATSDEIETATARPGNTVRPLLVRLRRRRLVTITSETRPTRAGRAAVVYTALPGAGS